MPSKRFNRRFFTILLCILIAANLFFIFKMSGVSVYQLISSLRHNIFTPPFLKPKCNDCNIVLISIDTLAAGHLPCYGYSRNTAPNLCQFAKDNIIFSNMYANASYTLPSHVSIFTGLYPSEHKVNAVNIDALSPTTPFLPAVLQSNGYKTYFYMGYKTYAETPPFSPFLPIDKVYNRGINEIHNVNHPDDWLPGLQKLKENDDKGEKTFLFLHTYWTHKPYLFEAGEKRQFVDGRFEKVPDAGIGRGECTPGFIDYLSKTLKKDLKTDLWSHRNRVVLTSVYNTIVAKGRTDSKSVCEMINSYEIMEWYYYSYSSPALDSATYKDHLKYIENLYDSKIFELDSYLKNVISFINSSSLHKNTILVITSDHGEEFFEHGETGHEKNLYNTTVRVPLMIYIPGIKNGQIDSIAQSVDIFPTILNLVGIKDTYGSSGKDLFSATENNKYSISQQIYEADQIISINNAEWKLILKSHDNTDFLPVELYHVKTDLQEADNVIFKNGDKLSPLVNLYNEHFNGTRHEQLQK